MKFESVLSNGRLWATVYDGEEDNELTKLFHSWLDPWQLRLFFEKHALDLWDYFHVSNVETAIYDTMMDATTLECMIFDSNPNAHLEELFRPLENSRIGEMFLSREKAKGQNVNRHQSWLRIYAIRIEKDVYLVTGGAIKLTRTMQEREHTLKELQKMEQVRNFLIGEGVADLDGLKDL